MVEGRNRHAELPRIAADLIQREEAVVAIEAGVLHRFGRHRTGILLEAHGKAQDLVPLEDWAPLGQIERERCPYKVKDLRIGSGVALLCLSNRPLDVTAVVR